ncbi:MAG TPA: VWA domain-containing protein [Desulfuromonadales bacterium]|nr:VWA domain-containing protein [Desulfuromonadales bacterium]
MESVEAKKARLFKEMSERESHLKSGRLFVESTLDVVFAIDTTGSMEPYIHEVRDNILKIMEDVFEYSQGVRMGVVAYKDHGDEGENELYLTKILPLTFDKKEMVEFLRSPDLHIGVGGNDAEAVECALYDAVNLSWGLSRTPKAIVLVGDKPAHGVIDSFRACTRMKDYRQEVEAIKAKGIKIYPILCNKIHETESSFRWMASETDGTFIYLDDISSLSDILTGICLKETGKLLEYKSKLLEHGDKVRLEHILLLGN